MIPESELSEMISFFRDCNFQNFFHHWNVLIENTQVATSTLKLEFYLRVHFAIHSSSAKQKKEAVESFKHFLENKGAVFSQENEFLPYFALPYVSNPENHPMYKDLYSNKFISTLEERLYSTLKEFSKTPQLYDILENHKSMISSDKVENFNESQTKLQQLKTRYSKLYSDYQSLISVSTDLVDALESNLRGEKIEEDFLQRICARLLNNQSLQSLSNSDTPRNDLGNKLRQSLQINDNSPNNKTQNPPKNRLEVDTHISLNYDEIKRSLLSGSNTLRASLLQSLRWKLTKSDSFIRYKWLDDFISHDFLEISKINSLSLNSMTKFDKIWVFQCLAANEDPIVIDQLSRFLNAFSSLSRGRSYLSQSFPILNQMIDRVYLEREESPLRGNLIGALQKLSLKRSVQTLLIKRGGVEWLIGLLDNSGEDVSDYSLEYSVALIMNLCLRSSGKNACIPIAGRCLKVLTDLLGNGETDILPYINGALYSILSIPQIRKVALSIDLEGILQYFIKEESPEMNRQFEYIIKELNRSPEETDLNDTKVTDSGDEDDEDEDEDGDSMELFIEENDSLINAIDQTEAENFLGKNSASSNGQTLNSLSTDSFTDTSRANSRFNSSEMAENLKLCRTLNQTTKSNSTPAGMLNRPSTPQHSKGRNQGIKLQTPSNVQIEKIIPQSSISKDDEPFKAHPEYQMAFNSKPKIPRTPEYDNVSEKNLSMNPNENVTAYSLLSCDPDS